MRLRRLDAGLLLVFEAVSRTGNLTQAADSVGLSASAVSHAVARLRDIFDDPLFLRRAQGGDSDASGEGVARARGQCARRLARRDQRSQRFQAGVDRPPVSHRALDAFIATLAPPLLTRLAAEAPGARIAFVTYGRDETRKALLEGRADLALGVFEERRDTFLTQAIGLESFVVVARRNHPCSPMGLLWTLGSPATTSSSPPRAIWSARWMSRWAARGLSRRTTAAMPQFLATFATVAGSDATATVTKSLAQAFAKTFDLAIYPPPIDLPPFELKILRARPRSPDPALDRLIAGIAEIRAA